jgi:gamma-D-glutamyl-L-lysine dipeptidyl-peptidase
MFGICNTYCAPLMSAKGHKNEMLTQILFGECVEILHRDGYWAFVKTIWDDYEGWVLIGQFNEVKNKPETNLYTKDFLSTVNFNNKDMTIPACSTMPNFAKGIFEIGETEGKIDSYNVQDIPLLFNEKNITDIIYNYLQVPYMWGGRTHAGIDCSGLTAILFKYFNIPLKHEASWQVTQGEEVYFLQSAQIGDLAFFGGPDGEINHVGILLNNHLILHATESSGCVTIDNIDNLGIIKKDSGKRTHQLRIVKRIKGLQ